MLACCEGHEVKFGVYVEPNDIFENGYQAWLSQDEAIELLGMLEGSECPVCTGWIPLKKSIIP